MSFASAKKNTKYSKRSNVMTPLNWMASFAEFLILTVAFYNYDNWLGKSAFILASLILIFYGYIYVYFAKKDPDRLQSEEYNLAAQEMALKNTENNKIKLTGNSHPKITDQNRKFTAQLEDL